MGGPVSSLLAPVVDTVAAPSPSLDAGLDPVATEVTALVGSTPPPTQGRRRRPTPVVAPVSSAVEAASPLLEPIAAPVTSLVTPVVDEIVAPASNA